MTEALIWTCFFYSAAPHTLLTCGKFIISRTSNLCQAEPDQSIKIITRGNGCTDSAIAYASFPAVIKRPQHLLISSPLSSSQPALGCTKRVFTSDLHPRQYHPVQTQPRHRRRGNLLILKRYASMASLSPQVTVTCSRTDQAERRWRTAPGSPPTPMRRAAARGETGRRAGFWTSQQIPGFLGSNLQTGH